MAAPQSLIDAIDQTIAFFNTRRMDLPDGFFDRKTQFVINGVPFETLLSTAPNDPLILMLARGPAGFRFTAKALQHAIPDAKIERPSAQVARLPIVAFELRLSGTLRGTDDAVDAVVSVTLRLAPAGHVEAAEATIDPAVLAQIREARIR